MARKAAATREEEQRRSRPEISARLCSVLDTGEPVGVLADRFGVHPSLINKWRDGISLPSAERLAAIAATMNVSAEWLLTGNGPRDRDALVAAGTAADAVAERLWHHVRDVVGTNLPITGAALVERLKAAAVHEARERVEWSRRGTLLHVIQMARAAIMKRGRELAGLSHSDVYLAGGAIEALLAMPDEPAPASLVIDPAGQHAA